MLRICIDKINLLSFRINYLAIGYGLFFFFSVQVYMLTILQRIIVVLFCVCFLFFFPLLVLKITVCHTHQSKHCLKPIQLSMWYSLPPLHMQALRLRSIPKLSMHNLAVNTNPSYKAISSSS